MTDARTTSGRANRILWVIVVCVLSFLLGAFLATPFLESGYWAAMLAFLAFYIVLPPAIIFGLRRRPGPDYGQKRRHWLWPIVLLVGIFALIPLLRTLVN